MGACAAPVRSEDRHRSETNTGQNRRSEDDTEPKVLKMTQNRRFCAGWSAGSLRYYRNAAENHELNENCRGGAGGVCCTMPRQTHHEKAPGTPRLAPPDGRDSVDRRPAPQADRLAQGSGEFVEIASCQTPGKRSAGGSRRRITPRFDSKRGADGDRHTARPCWARGRQLPQIGPAVATEVAVPAPEDPGSEVQAAGAGCDR